MLWAVLVEEKMQMSVKALGSTIVRAVKPSGHSCNIMTMTMTMTMK